MEKAQLKKLQRAQRQLEQEKKRKRSRILVWTLSVGAAALLAALAIWWPKPGPVQFAYNEMPTLGKADAKVKIVEFGDFKCPACAYFSQEIMSKIKTEYIDTGKASFHYQNYNIIGQDSWTASEAGFSIYKQSNEEFWKFYNGILDNQPEEDQLWATADFLVDFARQQNLNIDFDKLRQDIENRTYKDEIQEQQSFAEKKGLRSTPTVYINGVKLGENVALDYDKFKAAIEEALQNPQE